MKEFSPKDQVREFIKSLVPPKRDKWFFKNKQERWASDCLTNLSGFVKKRLQNELPITPDDLKDFYERYRTEKKESLGKDFSDFTLTHLLREVKKRVTYLSDLKRLEHTDAYDRMLTRYSVIRELLSQKRK